MKAIAGIIFAFAVGSLFGYFIGTTTAPQPDGENEYAAVVEDEDTAAAKDDEITALSKKLGRAERDLKNKDAEIRRQGEKIGELEAGAASIEEGNMPEGPPEVAAGEERERGDRPGDRGWDRWRGRDPELEDLSDEERTARIADLKLKFEDAYAKGDARAVRDVLRQLRQLGEQAYPEMVALLNRVVAGARDEDGIDLSRRDMMMIVGMDTEFHKYVLADETADTSLRLSAVMMLGMGDRGRGGPPGMDRGGRDDERPGRELTPEQQERRAREEEERAATSKLLRDTLAGERDEQMISALAQSLGRRRDEEAVPALTAALTRRYDDVETAKEIIGALARIGNVEAARTVADAADYAADEEVREAAEVAYATIYPPADGVMIRMAIAGQPAADAGLKTGDIIVSYNGVRVTRSFSLYGLARDTVSSERYAVEYYRGGVPRTAMVKGGDLGMRGDDVKKK